MIRCVLLLSLAALTACAGSAPSVPVTPAPKPVVEAMPLPPPPPPAPIEVAPPAETPIVPPPSPRLRISQRSVYEQDRAVRWQLENGLTVWYAWDESATGYTALVTGQVRSSPSPAAPLQPAGLLLFTASDRIDEALDRVRASIDAARVPLAEATVAIHGSLSAEWVEAAVAESLGALRGRLPANASRGDGSRQSSVDAGWDDLAALAVVATLLEDRSPSPGDVALVYDAAAGRATLLAGGDGEALGRLLAPGAEGEIRDARSRAARRAESGPGVVVSASLLEHLPGRHQPARPPSEIRDLPGRIERTPPGRVNALLARLAAALPPAE